MNTGKYFSEINNFQKQFVNHTGGQKWEEKINIVKSYF